MNELDKSAVSYQVVLTKMDKPSVAELDAVIAASKAAIAKRPAAHPDLIVTSSETKFGLDMLRAEIERIVRS
jgi:GTP-binding protein